MAFLSTTERAFLQAVSKVSYGNPFLPESIEFEREALGEEFQEGEPIWSFRVGDPERPVNRVRVCDKLERLLPTLRTRLAEGAPVARSDLALYEDGALFLLFYRYVQSIKAAILAALAQRRDPGVARVYGAFRRDWLQLLQIPGVRLPMNLEPAHAFACMFQVERGFHHIFANIIGASIVGGRLRAAVWQSIFTHDLRRYITTLYASMRDVTTLVTGPSGTGKELVARAIGLSGYVPFDDKTATFASDFAGSFHALNLSALPITLIESELFGHRRGAFTGAVADRRGWLEICEPGGAVFLDEIGDLDPLVQVKLLRVLDTRTFQPVGGTTSRRFHGKVIAATNRDLGEGMRSGRFRQDFYYRLCSDVVVTPSLGEQLRESPDVLKELLTHITRRMAGDGAESLADEVETWILAHLGIDYPWPGNIRELEQCVRNVLIRKEYQPHRPPAVSARDGIADAVRDGRLTADALLSQYCTLVFSQTGSYQETARRLQLDRRTVKSKVDERLLAQLRQ
jgi:transcriptional regulator with AAA-type ATPase domain